MDKIIHLPASKDPHTAPSIVLKEHWITQDNLDGLQGLLQWAEGYNAGNNQNKIPCMFEALMFYRSMAATIRKQLYPES